MPGYVDRQAIGYMHGQKYGQVYVCIGRLMDRWVKGPVNPRCMDVQTEKWIHGFMDIRLDKWIQK